MGRKPLGWSAIVLGILGIACFLVLAVAILLLRGTVHDWAGEYLEPANKALHRLSVRLIQADHRSKSAEADLANLIATGSERFLEATRDEIGRLQADLLALESSITFVDSSMEILSSLPRLADQARGFRESIRDRLAALREELARLDSRLVDAGELATRIREGGADAEQSRTALKALAQRLTPGITAVKAFLGDLGKGLAEVRARLGNAAARIGRDLTVATVVLCFLFLWLAIAHFAVFLAGKRLLEEEARLTANPGKLTPAR